MTEIKQIGMSTLPKIKKKQARFELVFTLSNYNIQSKGQGANKQPTAQPHIKGKQ